MYTLETKVTCWLSLQAQDIPVDIINDIWKKVLKIEEEERRPPPVKKKHAISKKKHAISKRTVNMMERW